MFSRISLALFASLLFAVSAAAHGTKSHKEKPTLVPANLRMEVKDFGRTGSPESVSRTIEISMSDEMRFEPGIIHVKRGETIRFVAANAGDTLHEMVIGTSKDLLKHAEMMQRFPGMEHAEPFMAHADVGQKAVIIWTFDKPGTFEFGCLVPGHFEAGMKGTIYVESDVVAQGERDMRGFGTAEDQSELNRIR